MTQNCDEIYASYGGKSPALAGFEGFLQGLSGILGLGGFWSPTNSDALTKETNEFQAMKETIDKTLQNKENNLLQSEREYMERQQQFIDTTIEANLSLLQDETKQNALFIRIIVIVLLIVIIYLIIL